MSAYEFGWVDASEDPCWVNLGAQEVFTTVTHGEGADVETFTHSLGFVGPHMRAHTDYYGKDWVKVSHEIVCVGWDGGVSHDPVLYLRIPSPPLSLLSFPPSSGPRIARHG
jgi:hypothetical protein